MRCLDILYPILAHSPEEQVSRAYIQLELDRSENEHMKGRFACGTKQTMLFTALWGEDCVRMTMNKKER
jgi:hypothetical protein